MTAEEWLGQDNQLGIDIWTKKYRNEEEDFDGWLHRISGGNERIESISGRRNSCLEEGSCQTED